MISNERLEQIARGDWKCVRRGEFDMISRELLELRSAFSGNPDAWMTIQVQSPTWDDPGGGPEYIELHESKPEHSNYDGSPALELFRKPVSSEETC